MLQIPDCIFGPRLSWFLYSEKIIIVRWKLKSFTILQQNYQLESWIIMNRSTSMRPENDMKIFFLLAKNRRMKFIPKVAQQTTKYHRTCLLYLFIVSSLPIAPVKHQSEGAMKNFFYIVSYRVCAFKFNKICKPKWFIFAWLKISYKLVRHYPL